MAATGLDALSHALESFVCTAANPYARMFASEGFARLLRGFEAVVEAQPGSGAASGEDAGKREAVAGGGTTEGGSGAAGAGNGAAGAAGGKAGTGDEEAKAGSTELWGEMLLGAHFAGAAIEASMLGAAHGLANPLTARYDITHGVAVAVMLDHVVRFNGAAAGAAYGDLARLAFAGGAENGAAAERLAGLWAGLRDRAGVAARLRDLDVREAELQLLAAQAAEQWTAQFNPRAASPSDMLALYRAAF